MAMATPPASADDRRACRWPRCGRRRSAVDRRAVGHGGRDLVADRVARTGAGAGARTAGPGDRQRAGSSAVEMASTTTLSVPPASTPPAMTVVGSIERGDGVGDRVQRDRQADGDALEAPEPPLVFGEMANAAGVGADATSRRCAEHPDAAARRPVRSSVTCAETVLTIVLPAPAPAPARVMTELALAATGPGGERTGDRECVDVGEESASTMTSTAASSVRASTTDRAAVLRISLMAKATPKVACGASRPAPWPGRWRSPPASAVMSASSTAMHA